MNTSHPSSRQRRLRWAFRLLLAVFFLAIQEAFCRFLFPLPAVVGFNRVHYQIMNLQGRNYQPILKRGLVYDRLLVESRPDGFSEVHQLNRYGFRGRDFTIEPPCGRRRIVLIGDSVTEGQGAPESGTISAEWERLLARDRVAAEVLNLGVEGASLQQLLPLARDAVSLLRPTDVVLVLYANDLPAPPPPGPASQSPVVFRRREGPPWYVPWVVVLLDRALRSEPIYRRWPHAPMRLFAAVPDTTNPWTGSTGPPADLAPALYQDMVAGRLNPWLYEQSKAIPSMLAHDFESQGGSPAPNILLIREYCRSVGARLIIAYVPFCGCINNRYAPALIELGMDRVTAEALAQAPRFRHQNAVLAEACLELGLPFADTTEALSQAEAGGQVQYWEFDTHPRPAGYATIARVIHTVWREHSL